MVLALIPHVLVAIFFLAAFLPVIPVKYRSRSQITAHITLGLLYLFCSSYFLGVTVNGEFNVLHKFLQAYQGAFHIGIAYFLWAIESEQAKPEQPLQFARLMASFFCLFTQLFAAWNFSNKSTRGLLITDNFIVCASLIEGVWFFSEVIRFFLNRRTPQEEVDAMVKRSTLWLEGKGNFYLENALYIDGGLSLLMTLLHFAFPQHILKMVIKPEYSIDSHHILWCRLFGCSSLIPALSSIQARYFSPNTQITYIASRLITQVVVFLLNIFGHWVLGIYSPNHITAFMISGFYMSFLFSAFYRTKNNYDDKNYENQVKTTTRIETRTVKTKST
ncbi:unnamed protein product [Auanema sp. JU1783]|nr:unnamed protein product [Auanema sp. JU1783]